MFNNEIEIRNNLNPLVSDFESNMINPNEKPYGLTFMFRAMKKGAELLLNEANKYPKAVLRLIVISDGIDLCEKDEIANVSNFLLQNIIRVDSIIISDEIAKELFAISHMIGGVSFAPKNLEEGIELFCKEEFFNVNIRQFGQFHDPNITANSFDNIPKLTVKDLDKEIKIKPNPYINNNIKVMSVLDCISREGSLSRVHHKQSQIMNQLKQIQIQQNPSYYIYPLEERVNIWRVLIKGPEGSLYEDKWFYMIIEFGNEYPQAPPLFRFVYPPFHPNITDRGLILDLVEKKIITKTLQ